MRIFCNIICFLLFFFPYLVSFTAETSNGNGFVAACHLFSFISIFLIPGVILVILEEAPLFRLMENFFLGFKLRKKNNVQGARYWTRRQINSRLGNKSFSFNIGNDHTLVRLSFGQMALILRNEVVAIGCVERFEDGEILQKDGKTFILYVAGPILGGDDWAGKNFRVLVCEAGGMKDFNLGKIWYRDRAPEITKEEEVLGIVQYGTWPYKTDFSVKNSVLDTEKMCLVS